MARNLMIAALVLVSTWAITSSYNLRGRQVPRWTDMDLNEIATLAKNRGKNNMDKNTGRGWNINRARKNPTRGRRNRNKNPKKNNGRKNQRGTDDKFPADQSEIRGPNVSGTGKGKPKRKRNCRAVNTNLRQQLKDLKKQYSNLLVQVNNMMVETLDPEDKTLKFCSIDDVNTRNIDLNVGGNTNKDGSTDNDRNEASKPTDVSKNNGEDSNQNDAVNVDKDDDDGEMNAIEPCVLSQWGKWKGPIAFGTLQRVRKILKPGCGCPEPDELRQTIDILPYINDNTDMFQNPEKVGDNFQNDFLTNGSDAVQKPRDILMILDSSGSIEKPDFGLMQEGVTTMIDLFCGGFGNTDTHNRLAIVQFASNVTVKHKFSDPQTPDILKEIVRGLVHYEGNTCTGDALQVAHDTIFRTDSGMRDFTVKDTLLVTDGQSNCGQIKLQDAADRLRTSTNLFALGVGIAENPKARDEVASVVSNEDPNHVFSLAKFVDFKSMVDSIKEKRKANNPCQQIAEQ